MHPDEPSFAAKLHPNLTEARCFRELDSNDERMIGISEWDLRGAPEMKLLPHEVAVIKWLRSEILRVSSPYEAANVGTLLVGETRHTQVVNHQFDHVGGGIVSISDGIEIASGEYHPHSMSPGEEYSRGWSIIATGLGDRCTNDTDTVVAPSNGGSEILSALEAGTLEAARHWFAHFPGKKVELVGAYSAARLWCVDPAAAETFFAMYGEYSDDDFDVVDNLEAVLCDESRALAESAQSLGCEPGDLLRTIVRSLAEATRDPHRSTAAVALLTGLGLSLPSAAPAPECQVPAFTETLPDGTRQTHP